MGSTTASFFDPDSTTFYGRAREHEVHGDGDVTYIVLPGAVFVMRADYEDLLENLHTPHLADLIALLRRRAALMSYQPIYRQADHNIPGHDYRGPVSVKGFAGDLYTRQARAVPAEPHQAARTR
jgi:hypothetical protein